MVRMLITDPMHIFLLGMVQNEVKLCLNSIPDNNLLNFIKVLGCLMTLADCQQASKMQMGFQVIVHNEKKLHVFMQGHVLLV